MKKIEINPFLFRSLDIRGAEPEYVASQNIEAGSMRSKSAFGCVLNTQIAYIVGKAIEAECEPKKVVVGHDARRTSPALSKALIKGLLDQGVDVDFIGLVTSDKLYFSIGYYKYDLGVMVTGSHTIKELNGFKMSKYKDGRVMPVAKGSGMEQLKEKALAQEFKKSDKVGKYREIDVSDDFKNHILSYFDYKKFTKQKIVFDAGNGSGGVNFEPIIDVLPLKSSKLYFKPDGEFPNHEPDPMIPENMKKLVETIKKEKADFGCSWDGDSDRVAFITKEGEILTGSFIAPMLLEWVYKNHLHANVVYTTPMSWAFRDITNKHNGKAYYAKVGNSFIKMAMEEYEAVFAGEEADHFMFAETYYAESGILPLLIILERITETGKSFDQLLLDIKKDYQITGDINIEVHDSDKVLKEIEKNYAESGASINKLDGLLIEFSDWHFSLRPSLNDPVVRLNLEAKSVTKRDAETAKIVDMIKKADT